MTSVSRTRPSRVASQPSSLAQRVAARPRSTSGANVRRSERSVRVATRALWTPSGSASSRTTGRGGSAGRPTSASAPRTTSPAVGVGVELDARRRRAEPGRERRARARPSASGRPGSAPALSSSRTSRFTSREERARPSSSSSSRNVDCTWRSSSSDETRSSTSSPSSRLRRRPPARRTARSVRRRARGTTGRARAYARTRSIACSGGRRTWPANDELVPDEEVAVRPRPAASASSPRVVRWRSVTPKRASRRSSVSRYVASSRRAPWRSPRRRRPRASRLGSRKPGGTDSFSSRSREAFTARARSSASSSSRIWLSSPAVVGTFCQPGGPELPGEDVVGERRRRGSPRAGRRARVGDRGDALDAAVEVPLHEVGGADVVARAALVAAEAEDPRVLEVAPDDRADADRLGQALHAGLEAAHRPHDQVDLRRRPATPRRARR